MGGRDPGRQDGTERACYGTTLGEGSHVQTRPKWGGFPVAGTSENRYDAPS